MPVGRPAKATGAPRAIQFSAARAHDQRERSIPHGTLEGEQALGTPRKGPSARDRFPLHGGFRSVPEGARGSNGAADL